MTYRLLLVDDEVKILDMIDNYLKREGFATTRAGNGNEALELEVEGSGKQNETSLSHLTCHLKSEPFQVFLSQFQVTGFINVYTNFGVGGYDGFTLDTQGLIESFLHCVYI